MICAFPGATARGQVNKPGTSDSASMLITLEDAMKRAKQYGGQIQSANLAAALAHEDRVQARAGLLPTLNAFNQFIYTEANGTASGVFVANDGVHVYNEQAVVHQDLLNIYRRADLRRAKAVEAVAVAKRDVAARGLNSTVVQNYYAIVTANRKVANAESSLKDAESFLDITRKQQGAGEAAQADVVKAEIQVQQRQRDLGDAQVAEEKAKVALGVLIFPNPTRDFSVDDDLDRAPQLEALDTVRGEAVSNSPDLRAARATVMQTGEEVKVAKYAYLPSLAVDFFYGINANQFAARTPYPTPESGRSTLPDYLVPYRQNLGYSGQVTLNIPVWTWGATRSKVKQAELRAEQSKTDLAVTQRQLQGSIESYYLEASLAKNQIESLRRSMDLSAESLRLTLLRYQAGEATVLEVVDAQTTLATARNAYADGLARYRVALANLHTLTGRF
jgi:outer membrane protein TolC